MSRGSGRGKFLSYHTDSSSVISTSSEDAQITNSGSGLGTQVNVGETHKRFGRGKLLDCLNNLSLGNSSSSSNITETVPANAGRGRALLLQCLNTVSQNAEQSSESDNAAQTKHTEKTSARIYDTSALYKPANTCGSQGAPIPLACNYIRLKSDPNKGVYMYEVRFFPNIDSNNLKMKYLNEHRDKFGGTKTFDGVTLYLPILLPSKLTTYVSKSVADGSNIEIRILFKRKESLGKCLHLYNVLFRRVMNTLQYVQFDRKHFDPTAPKIIPHAKLEIWPGYVTAVDEYEGGIMLCCDVSHKLLCQKTVLEMLTEIYRCNPEQFQENAKKSLLGCIIITRYNNQTYRIDDILFDKNPLDQFDTKSGAISFYDYYRRNYNIEIYDVKQPLLLSIRKQRSANQTKAEDFLICLIPELCYLTGLCDDLRKDLKLMREIATFTRVTPNQRIDALQKFYNNVNNCPEATEILNNWGLTLCSNVEHVMGRQLNVETIKFAKQSFSAGQNADFGKYASNTELLEVVHLNKWILMHCSNDRQVAKTFVEHMERNTKALGIQMQRPQIIILPNDRIESYVNALRTNVKADTQIVVCICPTNRDDRYAAIKKVCRMRYN